MEEKLLEIQQGVSHAMEEIEAQDKEVPAEEEIPIEKDISEQEAQEEIQIEPKQERIPI